MNSTELLKSISDLLEQKLEEKLEQKLEEKLDKKLDEKLDKKLDEKLKPVIQRLDRIEHTVNNEVLPRLQTLETKVDSLELKVNSLESSVGILKLTIDDMVLPRLRNMELNIENILIPRVCHIEECYLSTYERYQSGIDQLDKMQRDIDVIKIAVAGQGEEIRKITGPYLVK